MKIKTLKRRLVSWHQLWLKTASLTINKTSEGVELKRKWLYQTSPAGSSLLGATLTSGSITYPHL